MVNNDLTFFTNEPDRDLYSRFSNILKSHTQYFDILVGYFRTSGFFRMYEAMESVDKIRVLVGLNVDRKTVDIIDTAFDRKPTQKQAMEMLADEVEKEFENCDTTSDVEKGVNIFVDWLKSEKIEMRMYIDAPIHAKVYIMRKDPVHVPDTYGSVITGSSNFSEAGLKNNLEFNVELKDSRDVKFALERFEELWKNGIPITDAYLEAIQQRTWLKNDISPYEIYLKTLYEFFKEEINSDKETLGQDLLPDGYMKLQYQLDAVIQAKKILEAYNGVFISDVVGLGKTYICSMLAKSLKKGKKLVICPPVLVDYWKSVLLEFDVAATVESLGKLDSILQSKMNYDYVFVDEAHRFRNSGTDSYSKLHEICYGKKVVLISATPINNYASDIENQLYLFQPKHNSNIAGVKNLEKYFAGLRAKLGKKAKGTPEYMEQLHANSEDIRDRVLRHVLIRRTRGEIVKYYKDDMEKQGLTFPKLDAPEKIIYEFDDATDAVFTETINAIKEFTYARYKPLVYLKDPSRYASILAAQQNMGGFMKGVLVKRLESSFYAFRKTLGRFVESYQKFIDMYNSGEVFISKKVDVYALMDDDTGDVEKLMELVSSEDVMYFKREDFQAKFIIDLQKDLKKLEYLQDLWATITADPKLDVFKDQLRNNKHLAQGKKIVFTESKETAEYLESQLRDIYGKRVVAYSGQSGMALKSEIEYSFNPKYAEKDDDKFDVLITTDVLSEGINLHRSNNLVNYDLPWNPTRIMQRVGRINRVGSTFSQIYVYNFFPTTQSHAQVPLEDRILEKLQAFHDILGEDYKYLSDVEVTSAQKLFSDLTQVMNEEEDSNPELAYLAVIREIRDNDSNLFNKIKRLPRKAKTGRHSPLIKKDGTVTFIRKGALKTFYLANAEISQQITFIDAVKYLECEPDEPKIAIGECYYAQYDKNNGAFDDDQILAEDEIITTDKTPLRGNDQKVVRILRAIQNAPTLTDDQEDVVKRLLDAYDSGDIPKNISKVIMDSLKTVEDPASVYYTIANCVPSNYLYGRKDAVIKVDGDKQVILSCYLKETENE